MRDLDGQLHHPHTATAVVGSGLFSTLVLVDADEDMWLARVRFPEPPRPGLVFRFRGQPFQLTCCVRHGCIARPTVM